MSTPKGLIDLVFSFLILLMTYALAGEGLWGAALMLFNVLFSGLIAFNFYEPLAGLIDSVGLGWGFSDTLSLLSLFCISLVFFRVTTESLAPVHGPLPDAHLPRRQVALRPGHVARYHVNLDPGISHRAGAQKDLRCNRLEVQASLWHRAGPPVVGLLSVHDRRHLRAVRVGGS